MHRNFSFKNNFWAVLLICLAISVLCILSVSFIFALISSTSNDPTGSLGIFSLSALLISGAVSGFISGKIKKEGGIGFSALMALATTLIMLIFCIIISGKVSGGAIMNYVCYIGVSTLMGFLATRKTGRARHKR